MSCSEFHLESPLGKLVLRSNRSLGWPGCAMPEPHDTARPAADASFVSASARELHILTP